MGRSLFILFMISVGAYAQELGWCDLTYSHWYRANVRALQTSDATMLRLGMSVGVQGYHPLFADKSNPVVQLVLSAQPANSDCRVWTPLLECQVRSARLQIQHRDGSQKTIAVARASFEFSMIEKTTVQGRTEIRQIDIRSRVAGEPLHLSVPFPAKACRP